MDHQLSIRKETEGSIMILYGIKWKCKGPSNATDSETDYISTTGKGVL
jgi:hypothetical protein